MTLTGALNLLLGGAPVSKSEPLVSLSLLSRLSLSRLSPSPEPEPKRQQTRIQGCGLRVVLNWGVLRFGVCGLGFGFGFSGVGI